MLRFIAESNTSAFKTGNDDIINFLRTLIFPSLLEIYVAFRLSHRRSPKRGVTEKRSFWAVGCSRLIGGITEHRDGYSSLLTLPKRFLLSRLDGHSRCHSNRPRYPCEGSASQGLHRVFQVLLDHHLRDAQFGRVQSFPFLKHLVELPLLD